MKMLRIGICDDDVRWCVEAKRIIETYAKQVSKEMEIECFYSGKELLEYRGEGIDVLFLDIELEKDNGIQLAVKINEKWGNCQIVYLTNHIYYATEIYATKHVFFALKQQFSKKVADIFYKVYHEQMQFQNKYIFKVKGSAQVSVAASDIRYFEREGRITRMVTTWGIHELWEKLDEIYDRLPQIDFVRCHNSYIVYLPYIRELKSNVIITEKEEIIPISRTYQKQVKETFALWALTQMS